MEKSHINTTIPGVGFTLKKSFCVIIAIADELNIPVKYIGIGEALEDLREFNADEFVEALFADGDVTVH